MQRLLEAVHALNGQGDVAVAVCQQPNLECAGNENEQQQSQESPGSSWYSGGVPKRIQLSQVTGCILSSVDERHDQADADTEDDGEHEAGHGDIHADGDASVCEGQDIDGRPNEQEGDGWPQAGALLVDAGKQGQNGA